MSLSEGEKSLLEHVVKHRTERTTTTPQAESLGVGQEGGYKVQAEIAGDREIVGYKLGLLSPAKQAQMGIMAPIYGRIFPEMIFENPVRLSRLIQPRMEPELVVILGGDIAADASPADAWLAVGGVFLGIDFLDSIWEGYKFSIGDVIADNTSGGGFLLGEQLLDEPLDGMLRLYHNGALLTEGPVSALGNIGDRLAWLASQVGGLKEGYVIFLGSPAAALPAPAGTLELHGPHDSVLITKIED